MGRLPDSSNQGLVENPTVYSLVAAHRLNRRDDSRLDASPDLVGNLDKASQFRFFIRFTERIACVRAGEATLRADRKLLNGHMACCLVEATP